MFMVTGGSEAGQVPEGKARVWQCWKTVLAATTDLGDAG